MNIQYHLFSRLNPSLQTAPITFGIQYSYYMLLPFTFSHNENEVNNIFT